jgi:phosphate:Na+ symporter
MYKIIGELESLGDSGEAISRILSRRNIHKKSFDEATIKRLMDMVDAVDSAYEAMLENLDAAHKRTLTSISNAYNAEERINSLRNNLRDAEIEDIEEGGKNYQTSVYYIDIVNELERMGDFIINISQDLERAFVERD